LVDFERGGTRILPSLAEKWEVAKDGKKVTFHLRKNVQFQTTATFKPTRAFSADDVVFTFERMMKANHPYHKVNGGTYEYFTSMDLDKLLVSIEKVDDSTVKFHLSHAEAPFIADLGMDFASILSAEYGEQLLKAKTPEKLDIEPVGTGPFVFKSYRKDSEIRYDANPTYFEGKSPLDHLVFEITKDPNVRIQRLRRGECHLVAEPPPADVKSLRAEGKVNIMELDGLNVGYLSFNVEKKPVDKAEVRQAIAYALNRKAYIEAVYLGNATLAKNPYPASMWSFNSATKDYDYDPAKAKALLAKAGFANGFETTLWYLPVSRPYNPNGKRMAEMMQADLAKVGIKATLVTYDWSAYLEKARAGEHQMMQMGWTGDNGDPDNFLYVLLSCASAKNGSNYARWCNKKFDDLVNAAKVSSSQAVRTKLYLQAQDVFKAEAPWVTIAHAKVFRAMDKKVVGFKMSPFGTDTFYGVDLK
jgi:dipeptide transport system substrate-binding protein